MCAEQPGQLYTVVKRNEKAVRLLNHEAIHVGGIPARLLITAVCFLLGFGVTLQVRSVVHTRDTGVNTELERADELQNQLSTEKTKNDELSKEIAALQKQAGGSAPSASADNTQQLEQAEILAGLTDVHGPGVTVTMDDSKRTPSAGQNASAFVIHDSDILSVLNELRDAGAEALSINDERILATSEVRCAGNTVSINNNRYAAPFIIRAVGDREKLRSALQMKGGIADVLSQWGINVGIAASDNIIVKGYPGVPDYKYAKTGQGGS